MPSIKTPWGSGLPSSGAGADAVPPIPVPDHTLLRRIGKGSYGEVWLARNVLGVYRAVKIIQRSSFDHDRPFEREFAGMQRFEPVSRSHESQLNILHVGRGPGCFYYVMELADDMAGAYASGGTSSTSPQSNPPGGTSAASPQPPPSASPLSPSDLKMGTPGTRPSAARGAALNPDTYTPRNLRSELLLRGRLPVDECLRLGLALTTALGHLHRHGLVHRDIKPSNIVFVNGIPKLADIGLVARAEATMSFVGTEGYLPPEGPGTVQADVFSLGKVLYEISTGRDRQQFPELPTGITELPDRAALAELNEVLLRACAPDVKQRYESAAEMHADLALLQSGKSVARMRALERRLRFVQRAGSVVTAIALVATGLYFWQSRQARQMTRLAAEARHSENLARQNLYAADINLAQQALLADNLRQARLLLQNYIPKSGEPDLRGFEWHHLWQQSQSDELFSLPDHAGGAWRVAFSPDGRRLATGGADGAVKLWDLASRQEIARLAGSEGVLSVSFSPTADLLATGSDRQVWLWNTRTFARLRQLPGAILQAKFSPDGAYLLTLATNGLILWNTADWSVANSMDRPKPRARVDVQTAFAPDGARIAVVVDRGGGVGLFSVPELQEAGMLSEKKSRRPLVSFSPDNKTLATDSAGFDVKLWDATRQHELKVLHGHVDNVYAARFSPDGSRVATCSADQTIKLWDVATGRLLNTLKGQADEVFDLAYSSDGKLIASVGSNDGGVKLWDAKATARPASFRESLKPVGFDAKGDLVTFGEKSRPVMVDPATLKTRNTPEFSLTEERSFSPFLGNLLSEGRTLGLWTPKEQRMEVWNLRERKLLCAVESTGPWARFMPKRQWMVTVTSNETMTVWQLPSGEPRWIFTNSPEPFHTVAISRDENLILTDEATQSKLWRIEGDQLRLLATFNPKREPISGAAFSPDGRLLATGQLEGALIKLWAMPSAQEVGILSGHTRNVISLVFSPDGRTLASMCDDRTVRLWHVATRRELLRFQTAKEDNGAFSLMFSLDGRALAASRIDEDGPITWVWFAPSFSEIPAPDAKY